MKWHNGPILPTFVSFSYRDLFRLCSVIGIFYSQLKVHFIIWPPLLSLLIANDKLIIIH